jgi:cysteinyl-tRNA synthetase
LTKQDIGALKKFYSLAVEDILGLSDPANEDTDNTLARNLIDLLLKMRIDARNRKDFGLADKIRDELLKLGVEIMDTRDGFEWKILG